MTSEIEDAVARVEQRIKLLERPINYAAFLGDSDGADDAEVAAHHNRQEAALLRTLLSALTASQAEVERLGRESADLTKALTGLTRQGSEFFVQRGERFVADIPACVQDVRERMQRAQQAAVNFAHDKQAAEARATRAEGLLEALANAADVVGVAYFDSDDLSPEVEAMQSATLAARAFLDKLKEQGQ